MEPKHGAKSEWTLNICVSLFRDFTITYYNCLNQKTEIFILPLKSKCSKILFKCNSSQIRCHLNELKHRTYLTQVSCTLHFSLVSGPRWKEFIWLKPELGNISAAVHYIWTETCNTVTFMYSHDCFSIAAAGLHHMLHPLHWYVDFISDGLAAFDIFYHHVYTDCRCEHTHRVNTSTAQTHGAQGSKVSGTHWQSCASGSRWASGLWEPAESSWFPTQTDVLLFECAGLMCSDLLSAPFISTSDVHKNKPHFPFDSSPFCPCAIFKAWKWQSHQFSWAGLIMFSCLQKRKVEETNSKTNKL